MNTDLLGEEALILVSQIQRKALAMKTPHLDEDQARDVAEWLYGLDVALPKGIPLTSTIAYALFLYANGKTAREAADLVTANTRM